MWTLGEKQQLPFDFVALFIYTPCKCNKIGGGWGVCWNHSVCLPFVLSEYIYVDYVTVGNRFFFFFLSKTKIKQGELLRWFVLYMYQYTEWEFTLSRLCCLEAHCGAAVSWHWHTFRWDLTKPRGLQCYTASTGAWMLKNLCWLYKKKTHTPCAKFSLPTLETYKQAGLNGCAVGWRSGPDAGQAAAAAAAAIDWCSVAAVAW